MSDTSTVALDWEKAKAYFDQALDEYKALIGHTGVNTSLAIMLVFDPLLKRYNSGERSQELYNEMLAVE